MQQTIKKSLKLIWNHFLILIVSFFLLYPFGWLVQKQNGMLIYSSCTSFLYFSFIYSEVWNVAKQDKKPYSINKPYFFKGLVLGLFGSIVNVILCILFFIAKAGFFDFGIMNVIYRMWMVMFLGFFEAYAETSNAVFWLVLLVKPIAAFLGYIAGLHNFSISDKIATWINYSKSNRKKLQNQK